MALNINHTVDVDFSTSGTTPVQYMKQGDSGTREITVKFYNNGAVYAAPQDVNILQLAYCKSDKVGGCYDHMPDGSVAGRFNSARTAVTMQLHPQVLNVAGNVFCELRLLTQSGDILNTFNFIINCQKSPVAMTLASEGYYNNVFDGATFIPHIAPDGTVSWTNNKGLQNPAPVNVKGPKGDKGPQGPQGDPGSDADVPDWAKQPAKPDYQANEIDYHTTFLGEEVGTVDDALAVAEEAINKKTFGGLPIANAKSSDGINYNATGDDLPEVRAGDGGEQIQHVGKGKQIVFIPYSKNETKHPKLKINDGETIEIRMRAASNHSQYDSSPDATDLMPVGALMRGVPYTMTFCGKYWLVDSMIGGGGTADEQVFIVTADFNTETMTISNVSHSFADIAAAYDAKKIVFLRAGSSEFEATAKVPNAVQFSAPSGSITYTAIVRDTGLWTASKVEKVNEIIDSATNFQYPSALAVFNYVNSVIGNVSAALSAMDAVIGGDAQ